jgi:hypothetical protein
MTMSPPLDRRDACNALYAAGHHMLERDRIEDAAVLFRTMLLADAEDERGWLALGTCHERLEQDAMAEELYSAGAQIARSKLRCLVAVARLFRRVGDDRAEDVLDAATDLAATDEEEELVQLEKNRRTS